MQNTTEPTARGLYTSSQPVTRPRYLSNIAVYSVIMLVSLVGNSLVLAVVYRNENRRMRTISNYFIVKMSCSDLLITVCLIPLAITDLTPKSILPLGRTFRNIWCKVRMSLFQIPIGVSLLSLAIITVDRFLLIFYPHKIFITAKRARILIGTIWLIGIIFNIPLAVQTQMHEHRHQMTWSIGSNTLSKKTTQVFFIASLVVLLVLPLATMVSLYASIVIKLFRQKMPGEKSTVNQEHSNKRNRKVLLMLVTIVTLTIVCWLPYWSANIDCVLKFRSAVSCSLRSYLRVLALASCALNPCVYVIFNESFRLGFDRILYALFCACSARGVCCKNRVLSNGESAAQFAHCIAY